MLTVERLTARAELDVADEALERARAEAAEGDESWGRWVAEHERGEALIVRLDVEVTAHDGQLDVIELGNRGVFVEKDVNPPKVEQQIAELARKDLPTMAARLQACGYPVSVADLAEMFIHVSLDAALRDTLRDPGAARRADRGGAPEGDAEVSRTVDERG